MVLEHTVLDALKVVRDPDLNRDIVSLGFIKNLKIDDGRVAFTIELTTPACPVKDQMRDQARAAVMQLPGVASVDVHMSAMVREAVGSEGGRQMIPGVKNVIAVGAGKGGVGKTTVAVNLALALAKCGGKVGMIDGDIYGPNVPIMLGMKARADYRRSEDRTGREVRAAGHLDGLSHERRCADHLARADAARRIAAVLPRRALARPRLPHRRHAAWHRRRCAQPEPDRPGRGLDRRHHTAAGVVGRHASGGGDVQEAEYSADRTHRKHELLRVSELRARIRHLRTRRRRAARGGARHTVSRPPADLSADSGRAATRASR